LDDNADVRRPAANIDAVKIDITPLILTFNEKENIPRTLERLSWAKEVVVIDSGSTDGTVDLARAAHSNVRIVTRAFDSFAAQCNFGLTQINTEWVLSMDADYVLDPELIAEIQALDPAPDTAGYAAEFRYCIFGRPLRSSVYPARTVLYRGRLAKYRDEGHGHRVTVQGKVEKLSGKIDHDDRKPLSHWLQSQNKYTKIEAKHLLAQPPEKLSAPDRLRRKVVFAAPVMFFYLLFARGLLLDGWPGWIYVCQRTIAELLLSLRLLIESRKLEDRS
jgi:glycosyltransferase involved in cell wall biosynthesis